MVTTVSIETVASGDLLTLAAMPKPTMILDMKTLGEIDRQVICEVVAASIPTGHRSSRRVEATRVPSPRSARLHVALEGAH